MMRVCSLAMLVLSLSLAAGATDTAVTPVQKVIQLLEDMVAKGQKEKQDEQVQFAKFKTFCENTVSNKQRAIKDATEMIGVLQSDIEKYGSDVTQLSKDIREHDADISTWEGDLEASTKVRSIENNDYKDLHKDYSASIKAVEDGIAVIQSNQKDVKGAGAALLQLKATHISEESRKVMQAFFHQGVHDENLAVAAPEARAYESQTAGVVQMLQGLLKKFDTELSGVEEKESTAKHDFGMLSQALRASLDESTAQRSEKAEAKAKNLQRVADAKGQLTDTTGTRDADEKYADDLITTCEKKSSDFANRQQLRAEEIVAVNKAIEIMSSGSVAGNSEKNLPQLLQLHTKHMQSGSSFAQLRADPRVTAQLKVAAYLKGQAIHINSRVLSALATRVMADPFKKVKKMIKDLIVKLMEEAQSETEQKGYCDKEMSTNKHTRQEKTETVELLTADIDELSASVASLTDQIADLNKGLAELDEAVEKAMNVRFEERAKNKQTISESKEAQVAVENALTVLNEFYAKAADATSLLQSGHRAEPEIFGDEPYKGMGGESGGVVGMMEVIQSDFARLEADTTAAEDAAQQEYDEFMKDSKLDKTKKSADVNHKSSTKQDHEQALQEKTKDLDGTEKELDAAMKYYEKLKPTCVETGVSYEDKVARREEEIDSLKTALRVLNNEDVA